MTRIVARPYPIASPDTVVTDPYTVEWASRERDNPRRLDGWDFNTPIRIVRDLEVDRKRVLRDCELGSDASLAAVIAWEATGTRTFGVSHKVTVEGGPIGVVLDLDGVELGGALLLNTRILLVSEREQGSGVGAYRYGSILWEDPRPLRIALEGDSARFPMNVVDFGDYVSLDPSALWALHVGRSSLEDPFLGSVWLFINSRHPAHAKLVGATPDPAVTSVIRAGVVRLLLERALDDEDFDDDVEWPADSVGAVLTNIHRLVRMDAEGTATIDDLRGLRDTDRMAFETRIQRAARLLRDKA